MFLPVKIDVHGLWVRSNLTDRFGRISFPAMMDGHEGYWVMWEPKDQGKHGGHTASWSPTEELVVRPYKPKPWFTTEYFHSITDIELFIREVVRDELARSGIQTRVQRTEGAEVA